MKLNFIKGSNPNWEAIILPAEPNNEEEVKLLEELKNDPVVEKIDHLDGQMAELIKINHPQDGLSDDELAPMVKEFFANQPRDKYGCWVYYHWRRQLVRLLSKEDFVQVRTSRNQYKITKEEQELLSTKKIGVIGLSVGQSVALSLAMERSFGELRIADFDTLELSNMNRIRTGVYHLGVKKAWMVSREIAEIDPFLKVVIYEEGITDDNINEFFESNGGLDLLVEECDSLPVKIKSRIKAKSLKIPVIMDTSDRGLMDIERFDDEPQRPIFHGFLEEFGEENELAEILQERYKEILMSILDFDQLSERLKMSMEQIGKTITTWPQLASSVIMGGAMGAHYARMILLNQKVPSKRFYVDLEEVIGGLDEG
ncbi:ThiF family adenylyltransferase [Echinicola salinicaeni]|uniref:ThiF family adenylyltransferase n=1 Tax=Echinicola salinicaeni TaxID=2762757 RepID=UPI001644415F|nr:ThiF family adenylyltransferase [Echinicola salinicaeni]